MVDDKSQQNHVATPEQTQKERGPGGKFLPGNKIGKGNALHRRMDAYRRAWARALTPEMIEGVMRAMVKAALQGDVAAGKLVLSFAGKPPEIIKVQVNQVVQAQEEARAALQAAACPQFMDERHALLLEQSKQRRDGGGNGDSAA